MKKLILRSCAILVLGLGAMQVAAPAQETPGIEGVWFVDVTPRNCQTGDAAGSPFRGLYMFVHDGSVVTDAAFFAPSPRRSSGLGSWRHTQANAYTSVWWFFRYNQDGSFLSTREITQTIEVTGDRLTTVDKTQEYDANGNVTFTGCATSKGARAR